MGSFRRKLKRNEGASRGELDHVEHLRKLLLETNDLHVIANYFHDNMVTSPRFMYASVEAEHARMVAFAVGIAKAVRGEKRQLHQTVLHHPEYQLFHGVTLLEDCEVNYFYFEDIDEGVASIVSPSDQHSAAFRIKLPEGATAESLASTKLVSVTRRSQRGQS